MEINFYTVLFIFIIVVGIFEIIKLICKTVVIKNIAGNPNGAELIQELLKSNKNRDKN